jgi:hypothetical protein
MTGSALAPFVIPIVVIVALAAWLALVFHADAHPSWHADLGTASGSGPARADASPRPAHTDSGAHDGEGTGSEPAPVEARHAA